MITFGHNNEEVKNIEFINKSYSKLMNDIGFNISIELCGHGDRTEQCVELYKPTGNEESEKRMLCQGSSYSNELDMTFWVGMISNTDLTEYILKDRIIQECIDETMDVESYIRNGVDNFIVKFYNANVITIVTRLARMYSVHHSGDINQAKQYCMNNVDSLLYCGIVEKYLTKWLNSDPIATRYVSLLVSGFYIVLAHCIHNLILYLMRVTSRSTIRDHFHRNNNDGVHYYNTGYGIAYMFDNYDKFEKWK